MRVHWEGLQASPQDSAQELQSDTALVSVPEPSPLALQYYRSGNVLWAVGTVLGLLLPALLLWTGWSARLRTLSSRIGRRWLPSLMIYAVLFTIVMALLGLPFSYYVGFVRQHAYGLSNQTFDKWASDWVKGVLVSGIGLALVLWIPYLLLRISPRRWWLYAALASIPITTIVLVVSPILVDPLFNEFGPLRNRSLEQRILALAGRAGIPDSRVFQVNKSVDTKRVNAYVTGLGQTKRIVLWDTLLDKLEPDQVAFVVAHEIGHFVLRHVLALIALTALLALASLYLIHRVAGRLIRRFSARFGFSELSDPASLPLLVLLATAVSFVSTPLLLAFTRYQEHEADRFALELTRDNRAAANAFVRLQQENLAI
ncbi:MAG TPA: M48 family metallopeptidase, partial [Gemmatimonadales bacterium]|nr:M48 family metallopeptidase [Gemmatimonadales bacterium]